jgi:uncharacterized protein YqgC (DUF456 family)
VDILWAIVLIVILLACWTVTLFGLPGNWLMVIVVGVYWFFVTADSSLAIGWPVVAATVALAALGELVEFAAAAAGAGKAGGSKRAAVLALVGSLLGGVFGLFVGLPIPVVGQVVAALLFASFGALCGALLGEQWKGRTIDASLRVGWAAFWGRLLGTLGKLMCGGVMIVVVILGLTI